MSRDKQKQSIAEHIEEMERQFSCLVLNDPTVYRAMLLQRDGHLTGREQALVCALLAIVADRNELRSVIEGYLKLQAFEPIAIRKGE